MVRLLIFGGIVAIAFTLYALVDAAMADSSRARGVPKPAWIVIVAVLPVIGGLLWLFIGKGEPGAKPVATPPDDDPRFSGTRMSDSELDEHMRDLEQRLRELDEEVFPGEDRRGADEPPSDGLTADGGASRGADDDAADPRPQAGDDDRGDDGPPSAGPRPERA